MVRVRSDCVGLALAGRVDELNSDEIRVWDRMSVSNSQRVFQDRLDGSPDVDDLIASLEQFVGFLR